MTNWNNQEPLVPRDPLFFFFSIRVLLVLAPSRKPTKHEKVMAMLELSKQFRGFQVGVMARGKNQNME
jgi:hypothetical protein